jgi:hypothetical protein
MDTVGDPGFHYHGLLAQVWSLLILEFCDRLVLPFDMTAYSASVTKWAIDLENWAGSKGANQDGNPKWSSDPLQEAVLQFANDVRLFEKWEMEWDAIVLGGGGFESAILAAHRKSHNTRMANFETHLLDLDDGGGVRSRPCFRASILTLYRYPTVHNSSTLFSAPSSGPAMTKRSSLQSAML